MPREETIRDRDCILAENNQQGTVFAVKEACVLHSKKVSAGEVIAANIVIVEVIIERTANLILSQCTMPLFMKGIIKSMKLARVANKNKTPIKILYSLGMSCIE